MENEEQGVVTPLDEEKILLKEYQKLKENTVSKEKYEADLKAEKDRADTYLQAITEGSSINAPSGQEDVSLEDKVRELSRFKGTNLEYWTKMTSAIDSVIKQMPEADIVKITGDDGLEEIIKVNEGMKKMVKDADGDPDAFRILYKNRITESAPRVGAEIEKAGGVVNYFVNQQNKK